MASLRRYLSKSHQDLHQYAERRLNVVETTQKDHNDRLTTAEREIRELRNELGIVKKEPPAIK
eukprot:4364421-Pyramimonas_sp.AAC.1